MRHIIGLALILLFFQTSFCSASFAESKPHGKTQWIKIESENKKRRCLLHVPNLEGKDKVPLVLVLHGFLTSPHFIQIDTRMVAASEERGFIVAFPKGRYKSWNAGDCCGRSVSKDIHDVDFLRQVVSSIQAQYPVDTKRIYVVGMSNGAMMALRTAQEAPDLFAAAVSVEGCVRDLNKKPAGPISIMMVNGTKDRVIPIKGETGSYFGVKIRTTPVSEAIRYWTEDDHCSPNPVIEKVGYAEKSTYQPNPPNGLEVTSYVVDGNRHAWPGGRYAKFAFLRKSLRFDATKAVCDFIYSHPKVN